VLAILALALVAAGQQYGERIVPRLSDHRGFDLIAVDDKVSPEAAAAFAPVAPRRVYFVLVDGLRADVAASLPSWQALAAAGICRRTHVSMPTVSRPVYAMISTGVEQDRSGARNNDETSPLAAESIWQVAREAGRHVAGFSSLPWWRELFPDGFSRYVVGHLDDDYFKLAAQAAEELVLVHPVFVDEAGHHHGAASRDYRDAAVRADRQLGALLAAIDLTRDVILVTADHGHSATGGHGGATAEVATVLTCYAGRNVTPAAHGVPAGVTLEARSIGPLLAVLAGLRFPRHMRPGLGEAVWSDVSGLPAAYLGDRRAAERRFEAASAGLPAAYARGAAAEHLRGALAIIACALAFAAMVRRRRLGWGWRGAGGLIAWMAGIVAVEIAVYVGARGSFDTTSINMRGEWIGWSAAIGLAVCGIAAIAHIFLFRAGGMRLTEDLLTLAAVGVAAAIVHAAAYGWVLGFPLPGAVGFFMPFFIAAFTSAHALVAFAAAVSRVVRGKK
jgi:hypothetical protein